MAEREPAAEQQGGATVTAPDVDALVEALERANELADVLCGEDLRVNGCVCTVERPCYSHGVLIPEYRALAAAALASRPPRPDADALVEALENLLDTVERGDEHLIRERVAAARAALASRPEPPAAEGEWEVTEGVRCVSCPACAFTFDAEHTDADGSYSCPACFEVAAAVSPAVPPAAEPVWVRRQNGHVLCKRGPSPEGYTGPICACDAARWMECVAAVSPAVQPSDLTAHEYTVEVLPPEKCAGCSGNPSAGCDYPDCKLPAVQPSRCTCGKEGERWHSFHDKTCPLAR